MLESLALSINYSLKFHWNTAQIADETDETNQFLSAILLTLTEMKIVTTNVKMVFLYQILQTQ